MPLDKVYLALAPSLATYLTVVLMEHLNTTVRQSQESESQFLSRIMLGQDLLTSLRKNLAATRPAASAAAPPPKAAPAPSDFTPMPSVFVPPAVEGRWAITPKHCNKIPFTKYRRVREKLVDGVLKTYLGRQPFSAKSLIGIAEEDRGSYLAVWLPGCQEPVRVEYSLDREILDTDEKGAVAHEALYIYMRSKVHRGSVKVKLSSIKGARVCTLQ